MCSSYGQRTSGLRVYRWPSIGLHVTISPAADCMSRIKQASRRSGDAASVPPIFNRAVNRFKIFSFAMGPFSENGHLRLLNTYTSLGVSSRPISTLGGTWKVVKLKIWGGIYKFIMSARVDGVYNNLWWAGCIMFLLLIQLTFSFPDRISSDV